MSGVLQVEAARRLHVHPNTIANMLTDGRLKAVVVGSSGGMRQAKRRVEEESLIEAEDEMFGRIRRCGRCDSHVSAEEARQRIFNTGRCHCGGELRML
jgi:hypothetical protein